MFIKKAIITVIFILGFISLSPANEMFSKVASDQPTLVQKGAKKAWCPVCGMNLKRFYKTSYAYHDQQFCSLRCLAVDMQDNNMSLEDIKVVDAKTEKLIPATTAWYVVGSKIKGTMTKVSKLAFATKTNAEAFVKIYGGKVVDFKKALALAKASLSSDIAMITQKKEKKIYPMGKKLFEKKCQADMNLSNYSQINALKASIVKAKLCSPLKEKQLQAVALYLWEVKRVNLMSKNEEHVNVKKDEKCPVCGMFTYKYPKWAAQIFYKDGEQEEHYSFDGVKDLMKFYFDPMAWGKYANAKKANISKILVTDYYTQKAIDGTKAFYVVGSDVLGAMGNELIPFAHQSDAKTFLADHHGKSIVTFDKITKEEVYKLDQ